MPQTNLKLNIFIFLLSMAILVNGGGGGGGERFKGSSSAAASSSSEEGNGNHHHHHRHRNHGPKPTPSPPAKPKCEENWYTSYRPQGIWCLRFSDKVKLGFLGHGHDKLSRQTQKLQFSNLSSLPTPEIQLATIELLRKSVVFVHLASPRHNNLLPFLQVGIGHLDYHQAQAQCATYGGVLSGIQNDWERQLIANETVRQLIPHNVNIAGVWLGALHVDGANTHTFAWNDGFTTGKEGMFMGPGQPDNALGSQNCLQLIVMTPNYWNAPDKWQTFNRVIDDYWCHLAHDPPQRMYACGKRGPPVTSG